MMTEEAAVAQMAIVATLNLVCNQCVCVCVCVCVCERVFVCVWGGQFLLELF